MNDSVDLLESLDLSKIQSASRTAAWGSLLGGLIVVTAIVFSVIRIRMLDREVAERATKVQQLEDLIEPLKRTKLELETQVASKKGELESLQTQLITAESKLKIAREQEQLALAKKAAADRQLDVARNSKLPFEKLVSANFAQLKDMGPTKEPVDLLRVGVVPSASAKPLPTAEGAKPFYSFSLWLEYLDEQVKQVADEQLESVVYTFNHISFGKDEQDRRKTSADKANGFRVGYEGWGAVSNVIIELRLRNGQVARLDFDMHAVLPDVPAKGPPAPRPPAYRD